MTKKMFGDYSIYCDGKIFGLICDDCFYLKQTEKGRLLLKTVDMRQPYEGAKDYFSSKTEEIQISLIFRKK